MAIKIPTAGTNLNWGATASWVGGVVPVTGDFIQFETGKSYYYTSGLDQSAVNLAGMVVPPLADVGFGGSGLTIDISSGADAYLAVQGSGNLAFIGDIDSVICASSRASVSINGGAVPLVQALAGVVRLGNTTTLTRIHTSRAGRIIADANASTRIAVARCFGGAIETNRSVEDGLVSNGTLTFKSAATITDGATGGKVCCVRGAIQFQGTATAAQEIELLGGDLDVSSHQAALTLAALTIDRASSRVSRAAPGAAFVITATTDLTPAYLTSISAMQPQQNTLGSGA